MNIDPVNTKTQDDDNLVEVKTYSDVVVQTTKISSEDPTINHTTSIAKGNQILKVNQENNTRKIRENQSTSTPYQHLNHKSRQLN